MGQNIYPFLSALSAVLSILIVVLQTINLKKDKKDMHEAILFLSIVLASMGILKLQINATNGSSTTLDLIQIFVWFGVALIEAKLLGKKS